ncbi:MAG TPA: thiamine diphosphokinase [Candidatus Rhabdochlamydia sp.]|jgi:thiamine pyrophosphokinase|nr:thiamine diphosphokinase [Candidatus Rhabdochlamydia sp.]
MILPPNSKSSVAIICKMPIDHVLYSRIQTFSSVIAVDQGLEQCFNMKISPNWVVGDFDSVSLKILAKIGPEKIIQLKTEKDFTDLEAAIEKAKTLERPIFIFGALGERMDHTLGNIFQLLNNPGVAFIESKNQIAFAINSQLGKVQIENSTAQTLSLFALNGPAQVNLAGEVIDLNKQVLYYPFHKKAALQIQKGECVVCLDQRKITPIPDTEDLSLVHFFTYLCDSKKNPIHILPGKEVHVPCRKNQVISLIPFYGPVAGITTHGLKWELTNDQLDKHFIGISNICLNDSCTISIKQGDLLCMINKIKID